MRFFAAEGVLQGHKVFVVLGGGAAGGGGERWGRDLPGLAAGAQQTEIGKQENDGGGGDGAKKEEGAGGEREEKEKMKIAWRYERLGEFGGSGGGLAAGLRGTKYVYFPVLSSLVTLPSEKKNCKKKRRIKNIILDRKLLLQKNK